MKKNMLSVALAAFVAGTVEAQTINVMYTTDVHGSIFPYDYAENTEVNHSLAQAYSYVSSVRDSAQYTILLDNGDFLQGTPVTYYYNFVDTISSHIVPSLFDFMKVDAATVGNHDIEPGHAVYDRVKRQMNMPWLAANAVDTKTGKPYFQPYTILERGGKRIAFIGLLTPHIPHWLAPYLWSGIEFEDMVESARKWVDIVKKTENPDVIIGMFHAGFDYTYGGQTAETYKNENASILVAEQVDGFDAILIGHDHKLFNKKITNVARHAVVVLDAGTAGRNLGHLVITFDKNGKPVLDSKLIALQNIKPSEEFLKFFQPQYYAVKAYSQKVIGKVSESIEAREALFGNSTFVDMVHATMLEATGADISFSAPLLIDVVINKGNLNVAQMFSIYRYENMLDVMSLSGNEIKAYLEYSYDKWIADPKQTGHVLNLTQRGRLTNSYYNFDSAAGINYTVNPFKPYGERIEIVSMADGSAFDYNKMYKVAMNSYRFNGGGGHLEIGVGLSKDEIASRLVYAVKRDLRGVLMDEIQKSGEVKISPLSNWKFVPEKDVKPYIEADMKLY